MKRFLALMAVAALAIMPVGGHADPGASGCAVAAGQGEANATITHAGGNGYIAGGTWKITIVREGVPDPIVIQSEGDHALPTAAADVFNDGDQITCEAAEGMVVAGGGSL